MILTRTLSAAAAAVVGLAACGGDGDPGADQSASSGSPVIVTTTGIWADITRRVACDGDIEVRALIPPGGDAHAFEPSLRDRQTMDEATLVVANGLGLEERLEPTLHAVASQGGRVLLIGEHVRTLEGGHDEEAHPEGSVDPHATDGDEHDHAGADPHVWFDPTRVADALPALGDALVAAGVDADAVAGCVTAAVADLEALDAEVTATLAAVPPERRALVTNHDSLAYFADRYDFDVLGTVLPSTSTLTEASPSQLEALGAEIEAAGVPAIFTETLHGSADARALAARLGVDVVELYTDSLGEPGSGADSYDGLMRTDAERIAGALGA